METHNAKGVPFDGRAAMRSGWDTKANPWPKDSWERMRWLAEWWFENADCFKSHIEGPAFEPVRLTVPASLYPDHKVTGEPPALTFIYRNWRGEVGTRTVKPIDIVFKSTEWHEEPQWILHAWDVEKNAPRDFAIKDINPNETHMTPVATVYAGSQIAELMDLKDDTILYRSAEETKAKMRACFSGAKIPAEIKRADDAPVSRVFPHFLRTETNTVATFIMEDGQPGPVACLTGDDHAERGRAIVHAVMSAGLTLTAAAKLVAKLAELEDENRALKAKIGAETDGQQD